MKLLVRILILASFAAVGCSDKEGATVQSFTELPSEIAELQAALAGVNRAEAYEITRRRFGEPERDIGSGFRIEQWGVDGGTLTFHQAVGPTFRNASGTTTWLIATRNEVKANLHDSFEMYSLHEHDPYKNGTGYWLGNIELHPTGKFEYRDSGQHREYKKDFPQHFFVDHLNGDFEIKYSEGVSAIDALEDIPDDKEICRITFRSGEDSTTFGIVTSRSGRSLRFESEGQVFRMNRGWSQYWPPNPTKQNKRMESNGWPALSSHDPTQLQPLSCIERTLPVSRASCLTLSHQVAQ